MMSTVVGFIQNLTIQLIALAIVWAVLVTSSWIIIKWCLKKELSWRRSAYWITGSMGAILLCLAFMRLFPCFFMKTLSEIIIPRLICAMALHSLLLAVDRYMRHQYGEGIIATRLVLSIVLVYVIAILGAIGLIKMNNGFLNEISEVTVDYLTKSAIVGLLLLEIFAGRCKDQCDDARENNSNSYSSGW